MWDVGLKGDACKESPTHFMSLKPAGILGLECFSQGQGSLSACYFSV